MFGRVPDFSVAEGIADARKVETLIRQNEKAWADYKNSDHFKKLSLNIPDDALRFLVPRELLAVAKDPTGVGLSTDFNSDEDQQSLGLVVYEGEKDKDNYLIKTHINSWDNRPDVLYSNDYIDHATLHGQGVGQGYYRQLDKLAKDLGFKYIVGINGPDNMSFFIDKLGRRPLLEAPKEIQKYLAFTSSSEFIDALSTYKEL